MSFLEAKVVELAAGLVREFEDFSARPERKFMRWSVGYGHTRTVMACMKITRGEADALLEEDLRLSIQSVQRLTLVSLNLHQLAALTSLTDCTSSFVLNKSRVLRLLNRGWHSAVPPLLLTHDSINEHRSARLAAWRAAEARLWRTPVPEETSLENINLVKEYA